MPVTINGSGLASGVTSVPNLQSFPAGPRLANVNMAVGSVLQVVSNTFSTEVSTSSSSFSDTGLTASITPSSTSSKILVFVDVQAVKKDNTTGVDLILVRGSTTIAQFAHNTGYNASTAYNIIGSASCGYVDSPASTSSTTYKVQMASSANSGTARINDNTNTSTIVLMEIAG